VILLVIPLLIATIVLFGFGLMNPWIFIAAAATALLAMISIFAHRRENRHV
jgi:membrane protein YdbS with pleckstrin-like domain